MINIIFQILWDMAFVESNRKLINKANGLEILTKVAKDPTSSETLLENIEGALYMFGIVSERAKKPQQTLPAQQKEHSQSIDPDLPHIMISYNWDVQPTVLKIAAALREAGYKLWLDVEQMKGSTLEASMWVIL